MPDSRLSLHVYRPKTVNILTQDRIVKSSDKTATLYHMTLVGPSLGWSAKLHRDTQDGPTVFEIAFIGNPYGDDISIGGGNLDISIKRTVGSPWQTRLIEASFPSTEHSFRGTDGQYYCWRSSKWFSLSNSLTCVGPSNLIIATYECRAMALYKDGELTIFDAGLFMKDLLLATCLALRVAV
ncbi:hypothetical protein FIBSPDRAFT_947552 [Athelia psychrophila]|uniref:Uncharacterized protein n=1 Tax=Athelia psychrophila TaxID=1759441 RepID=A0A166RW72_9AGAM|nr:hypothetical protein FIBSPDRAFT_947552 [Fibularhizoctonia sp. CBS 109695]